MRGAQLGEAVAGCKHKTPETSAPHGTVTPCPTRTLQLAHTVSAAAGEINACGLGSSRSCFISSERESDISVPLPSHAEQARQRN